MQFKQDKKKHSGLYTRLLICKKYAISLKRMKICYKHCILRLIRMQMNGYIPPHVHMHLCRPSVMTIWVGVPLWIMMFPATGP